MFKHSTSIIISSLLYYDFDLCCYYCPSHTNKQMKIDVLSNLIAYFHIQV